MLIVDATRSANVMPFSMSCLCGLRHTSRTKPDFLLSRCAHYHICDQNQVLPLFLHSVTDPSTDESRAVAKRQALAMIVVG